MKMLVIDGDGKPRQPSSLEELESLQPNIWPGSSAHSRDTAQPRYIAQLQTAIREHWGWRDQDG